MLIQWHILTFASCCNVFWSVVPFAKYAKCIELNVFVASRQTQKELSRECQNNLIASKKEEPGITLKHFDVLSFSFNADAPLYDLSVFTLSFAMRKMQT